MSVPFCNAVILRGRPNDEAMVERFRFMRTKSAVEPCLMFLEMRSQAMRTRRRAFVPVQRRGIPKEMRSAIRIPQGELRCIDDSLLIRGIP